MRLYFLLLALVMVACQSDQIESSYKTIGEIEVIKGELKKYLDPHSKIEILAEGYKWSEGPLWIPKRNKLLFSDVPQNTIYEWKEGNGVSVFLRPSGYTGSRLLEGSTGSNGLALDKRGRLVLCQHGDRRVARMINDFGNPQPKFQTLAARFNKKRFNSPNDLAIHKNGQIYFTDPPYGLKGGEDDPSKEIKFNGIYRVDHKGKVRLVNNSFSRPNGIAFSPDYKKCYVANSDPEKAYWKVFILKNNGAFTMGKVLFDATSMIEDLPGLPDGLKVHSSGTIFATGPGGVLILTPEGEHLGTISTGKAISNCTFDDKEAYLYMTSDDIVCRVKLKTQSR